MTSISSNIDSLNVSQERLKETNKEFLQKITQARARKEQISLIKDNIQGLVDNKIEQKEHFVSLGSYFQDYQTKVKTIANLNSSHLQFTKQSIPVLAKEIKNKGIMPKYQDLEAKYLLLKNLNFDESILKNQLNQKLSKISYLQQQNEVHENNIKILLQKSNIFSQNTSESDVKQLVDLIVLLNQYEDQIEKLLSSLFEIMKVNDGIETQNGFVVLEALHQQNEERLMIKNYGSVSAQQQKNEQKQTEFSIRINYSKEGDSPSLDYSLNSRLKQMESLKKSTKKIENLKELNTELSVKQINYSKSELIATQDLAFTLKQDLQLENPSPFFDNFNIEILNKETENRLHEPQSIKEPLINKSKDAIKNSEEKIELTYSRASLVQEERKDQSNQLTALNSVIDKQSKQIEKQSQKLKKNEQTIELLKEENLRNKEDFETQQKQIKEKLSETQRNFEDANREISRRDELIKKLENRLDYKEKEILLAQQKIQGQIDSVKYSDYQHQVSYDQLSQKYENLVEAKIQQDREHHELLNSFKVQEERYKKQFQEIQREAQASHNIFLHEKSTREALVLKIKDLQTELKEKQLELDQAFGIKQKVEEDLLTVMKEHQQEFYKCKNDLKIQTGINADLNQIIEKNHKQDQALIKRLNQELNDMKDQSNCYLAKYQESSNSKKAESLKLSGVEQKNQKLVQNLETLKKHISNMEKDFEQEILKRNDLIKQLNQDYLKLEESHQSLVQDLKTLNEQHLKLLSQFNLKHKENLVIREDMHRLDSALQFDRSRSIKEASTLKTEIVLMRADLDKERTKTADYMNQKMEREYAEKFLEECNLRIKDQEKKLKEKEAQIQKCHNQSDEDGDKILELKSQVRKLESEIKFLQALPQSNDERIEALQINNKDLSDILSAKEKEIRQIMKFQKKESISMKNKDQLIFQLQQKNEALDQELSHLNTYVSNFDERQAENQRINLNCERLIGQLRTQLSSEIEKTKNLQAQLNSESEQPKKKRREPSEQEKDEMFDQKRMSIQIQTQNDILKERIASMEVYQNQLEQDREQRKQREGDLKQKVGELYDLKMTLENRLNEKEMKVNRLLQQNCGLEVKIFVLFSEFERLKNLKIEQFFFRQFF